jgi:hypothetical protein
VRHTSAALGLILVGVVTVAVATTFWALSFMGPFLLPVGVAFFLFNLGYVLLVLSNGVRTRGAKLALAAGLLNLTGMLVGISPEIWTAFLASAIGCVAVGASAMIKEAKA